MSAGKKKEGKSLFFPFWEEFPLLGVAVGIFFLFFSFSFSFFLFFFLLFKSEK